MIGDKRIYDKFLFKGTHLVSRSVSDFEAKSLSIRLEIVFCIFPNRNSFSRNILPQLAHYIIF